jgi:epoxyqueuosine reductase
MKPEARSETIRGLAREAGFHHCGMAAAETLSREALPYREWLDKMQWGNMDYLRKNYQKRLDPGKVMQEAKTVIALMTSYNSGVEIPPEDNYVIARYARVKDYHKRIKGMLGQVIAGMKEQFGEVRCKPFVDSGVLLEKAWAQRCGLGWRGKNTLLINREHGSWFFIGIILTDLETCHDTFETDHCGTCDRCIRACPTGALEAPHLLNPVKCISYQTIENKETIPDELSGKFGNAIFGCDICQEVCPFNRDPLVNGDPACQPKPELVAMRRNDWEHLTPELFRKLFHDTPVSRTGYDLLCRNIRFISEQKD